MNGNGEKKFWYSKKFWFAVIGALVPPVNALFGFDLSIAEISGIVGPLMVYVIGQGIADAGKNSN